MKNFFLYLYFILIANGFSMMAMEKSEGNQTGFLCNGDCCVAYTIRPCDIRQDKEQFAALSVKYVSDYFPEGIKQSFDPSEFDDFLNHQTITQELQTYRDGLPTPEDNIIDTRFLQADVLCIDNNIVACICYSILTVTNKTTGVVNYNSGRISFVCAEKEYREKAIPFLIEYAFNKMLTTNPHSIDSYIYASETISCDTFKRHNFDIILDTEAKDSLLCIWYRRETESDKQFAAQALAGLVEPPVADESFIVHATPETFESLVTNAKTPVIVDIWAEWCFPCRRLTPIIAELAQEYQGRYTFIKFNFDDIKKCPFAIDQAHAQAQKNHVKGIPALFFISDGEVKGFNEGFIDKAALQEKIAQYFGKH